MDKLEPCPFCGGDNELPDCVGSQYEMDCYCGRSGVSVQISDLMTIEERLACPNLSAENGFKYPDEYIERAKNYIISEWNTRAKTVPLSTQAALECTIEHLDGIHAGKIVVDVDVFNTLYEAARESLE